MSDTNTGTGGAAAAEEVKTPGKIVGRGQPTFATPVTSIEVKNEEAQPGANDNPADPPAAGADPNAGKTAEQIEAEKNKLLEMTDEQLAAVLKGKGIELEGGLEGLKEKLKAPAAQAPAPTEEEKKKAEAAFEKRMLDHFIDNGGTVENFAALKQIASADLTQLSISAITKEMTEAGFEAEDISAILKERYYQLNPEELVRGEEETEEDFTKRKALTEKKIALGAKKLASKGTFIQKQATDALSVIRQAIEDQDLQKAEEAKISSKADEIASKLPRKMTFELGFLDDEKTQKIDPIEYVVQQSDIDDIVTTFKDEEKRKQFLYNQDGSLNLDNLMGVMLKNKILESGIKTGYIEGGNRQVAIFEKTFPSRSPQELGVGGASGGGNTGRKGVIASKGKAQPASPTYK